MNTSYFQAEDSEFHRPSDQVSNPELTVVKPFKSGLVLKFVSAEAWDQLVGDFVDVIPEQMGGFNAGHWGEDNLHFITFFDGSELVGGSAVIVKTIPYSQNGIAILKWGPLCQRVGTDFDIELYGRIIDCVKEQYCHRNNFHLTIMPYAKPTIAKLCESSLLSQGFKTGGLLAAPERYIVDVSEDSETLKANLDQKWRYNLRKALKNQFDIKIVDPENGLSEFLDLYRQMIERKKFLDASAIDALEIMIENSPKEVRPIFVLASHDGRITAGGVFHVCGDTASYMFGATDERALKLKAGYAMHWWVAEYLCNQNHVQWYDLGGNDLDKGLHQFKKGFVGKSGHILSAPPRYHYSNSLSSSLVGFAAFRVRDAISSLKRVLHRTKKKS